MSQQVCRQGGYYRERDNSTTIETVAQRLSPGGRIRKAQEFQNLHDKHEASFSTPVLQSTNFITLWNLPFYNILRGTELSQEI